MLWYAGRGIPFVMPPEDCDALADWMEASYPDELCASESFDPGFVDSLCRSGFIPMATGEDGGNEYLIPKMHVERSVMRPSEAAVTRTARRESPRYSLLVGRGFDETLAACVEAHGDGWLRPPLVACWKELFGSRASRLSRFSSMELCRDGRLVAGEIGVFVGSCYTSLTGFRRESGAGTVQLAATARYLESIGAELWDLGMPLDYKAALGAEVVPRSEFIARFRAARGRDVERPTGPFSARALIDRDFAA
jgi:arginyl-tRNA---protein transferase